MRYKYLSKVEIATLVFEIHECTTCEYVAATRPDRRRNPSLRRRGGGGRWQCCADDHGSRQTACTCSRHGMNAVGSRQTACTCSSQNGYGCWWWCVGTHANAVDEIYRFRGSRISSIQTKTVDEIYRFGGSRGPMMYDRVGGLQMKSHLSPAT